MTRFHKARDWAVLLCVFGVYAPALSGGFLWDDDRYVSENPAVQRVDGLWKSWVPGETPQFYPLVFTSFWLEARVWGNWSTGFHLVNTFLHGLNALLLCRLLRRLRLRGAWAVGLLFALHPVQVESVAWISERKNVLSMALMLGSALCYLRFEASGSRREFAWSLLLFVGALLCKTVTCVLPAVLVLLTWWREGEVRRATWGRMVPFLAVGFPLGLITVWLEVYHVGASGERWDLSGMQRVLLAGRAVCFYAGKVIWPAGLMFNYPRWTIDAADVRDYAYPAAVMVVVAASWWFRGRLGRGPLAGVLTYVVLLFPALGFFDVYPFYFSFVADHFQYHASAALLSLLIGGAWAISDRMGENGEGSRRIGAARNVGFVSLLLICAVLTFRQAGDYIDVETLWRRTVERNPKSWLAHYNLGVTHFLNGEIDEAARRYGEAVRLNPGHVVALVNLGNIAAAQGRHDEALKRYQRSIEIDPDEPTAHYNLAKEWTRRNEVERAIESYRACIRVDPSLVSAYNNLGLLFMRQNRWDEAREQFAAGMRVDPNDASVVLNMGLTFEQEGDAGKALEFYVRALAMDDGFVEGWYRAGVCWRKKGGMDEARRAFERAIALASNHVPSLSALASLDYGAGDFEGAVERYRDLLTVDPGDAVIRHNATVLLKEMGRFADAQTILEDGLAIDPNRLGLLHDLARLLIDCPDESKRDYERAVVLASRVVDQLSKPTGGSAEPGPLSDAYRTLIDALVAGGEWDRAIEAVEQAIDHAREADMPKRVDELRARTAAIRAMRNDQIIRTGQ